VGGQVKASEIPSLRKKLMELNDSKRELRVAIAPAIGRLLP
jgi:hypothetical protein